jgi:hypothetical protein
MLEIGQREFKGYIVDKAIAIAAESFVIPGKATHLFTYGQGRGRPWAPDAKPRPLFSMRMYGLQLRSGPCYQ